MATCPGCGVDLPGPADRSDPRSLASDACRALYGEVAGYELDHVAELGKWHQLLVDTYGAQHAGPASPPIGAAFALVGLLLALEKGWDGPRVRDAHQRMARASRTWPSFERPPTTGTLTVFDLAMAASPAENVERLLSWARDVWQAWAASHDAVRELVRQRLG